MQSFDLLDYVEITNHLNLISKIYKLNSNKEWVQILCPYCDDAYRKSSINHGHYYVSRYFNFSQCFRCETKKSIKQFLLDTNFSNRILLKEVFKLNYNINYNKETNFGKIDKSNILEKHIEFRLKYPEKYQLYLSYLKTRVGQLDFEQFKTYPSLINDKLTISFNNYLNEVSTIRFIDTNNIKYYKLQHNSYYFFQDIDLSYNHIVICEGVFDLINLYKYSSIFDKNNTMYFALNGRSYISDITKIILDYLMIGKYIINIVFDKNVNNIDKIKFNLEFKTSVLNSNIKYRYYVPSFSKDVSDFNLLTSA